MSGRPDSRAVPALVDAIKKYNTNQSLENYGEVKKIMAYPHISS